jgi:hypothetical protein
LLGHLIVEPALVENWHFGTSIKKRDEGANGGSHRRKQKVGAHRSSYFCSVGFLNLQNVDFLDFVERKMMSREREPDQIDTSILESQ